MTESMEIDPFNSNRFMYGTGATIYGTTDLTTWDTGGQITIKPMAAGLEETAVLDLISPPTGAPLISGLGDIGGFRHTNLDAVPPMMFTAPTSPAPPASTTPRLNPSVMVRAGNFTDSDRPNDSHAAFSTDGGANWFQGSEPGGINDGGTIAAAADGCRFVWSPGEQRASVYSRRLRQHLDRSRPASRRTRSSSPTGSTRTRSTASPAARFYAAPTAAPRFTRRRHRPAGDRRTSRPCPASPGDIWLAGGTSGLWRSTDGGATLHQGRHRAGRPTTSASARARPAGPTWPSSPSRRSTARRASTAPTTARAELGADQRRPAPVRQHRRRDHR